MPTITPTLENSPSGTTQVLWETMATGDTFLGYQSSGTVPIAAFVQVTGTFGGATVVLQGSIDGTNWVTLKNFSGDDLSFTAAGGSDFSTSARYIRASSSGGTGDDIDVRVFLRG